MNVIDFEALLEANPPPIGSTLRVTSETFAAIEEVLSNGSPKNLVHIRNYNYEVDPDLTNPEPPEDFLEEDRSGRQDHQPFDLTLERPSS